MSASEFAYRLGAAARHPATALLAAMSEVLPRLYGLSLEDWGVGKPDRLPPRSEDPLRVQVGRVAAEGTVDFVAAPYRFEVLPGVGHFAADQVPERVCALLLEHVTAYPV